MHTYMVSGYGLPKGAATPLGYGANPHLSIDGVALATKCCQPYSNMELKFIFQI